MARLPALVAALETTDGRERPTLDLIARTVREAGLISTTKRGSGASEMTVSDAVSLLIGANAVQSPRHAAIAADQYRTYRQSAHGRSVSGRVFSKIAAADTLAEALAVIVQEAAVLEAMFVDWVQRAYERPYDPDSDWILKPNLHVTFASSAVEISYSSPNESHVWRFLPDADLLQGDNYTTPGEGPGRRVTTTVLFPTFLAMNAVLFGKPSVRLAAKASLCH